MSDAGLEVLATIVVHDWDCRCSACGYGAWTDIANKPGAKIIKQDSEECPGCGARFTARRLSNEARVPAPRYLGDLG